MEIKLETASPKLLDKLFEIEQQCFDQEAFTKRQIAYLLTDYNTIGLIAKADNDLAGFVIAQVEMEEGVKFGHIITLNIAKEFRGKGIAQKLLREVETILKEKGIRECRLEVREDNHAAIKLYQALGYQKISKLERYYGRAHGLYLRKTL
jgi:[ribosomal protein S18]-alanine N-acetyltransferase